MCAHMHHSVNAGKDKFRIATERPTRDSIERALWGREALGNSYRVDERGACK